MPTQEQREAEIAKYVHLYSKNSTSDVTGKTKPYGLMPPSRGERIKDAIRAAFDAGCWDMLDVGCGRGFMLDFAEKDLGLTVHGVDVVPSLIDGDRVQFGMIHQLPMEKDWTDFVLCTDVMEHVLEGDVPAALSEIERVADMRVFMTISHRESIRDGMNLHVTMKPWEWWEPKIEEAFPDWEMSTSTHEAKQATEVTLTR